jgi:hypothetical protein
MNYLMMAFSNGSKFIKKLLKILNKEINSNFMIDFNRNFNVLFKNVSHSQLTAGVFWETKLWWQKMEP